MSERFNPVIFNMEPSITLGLNAKAKQLVSEGREVYNLSAGEPNWPTPDYIQEYVAGKLAENKYTPASGLLELREAVASYCRKLYKADHISQENIVITPGAKPALFSSLKTLLLPGDEVIIPSPYWVSYEQIVELSGGKMVPVKTTNDFELDVDAINHAITSKTKVIILNSPNNPTGVVYSRRKLEELAKNVKGKDIFILSDDIYFRLAYGVVTPITQCGFDPGQIVIVNGFSKSQALTGWRVGYVVATKQIVSMIVKMNSHILGNTSLPSQYAALSALEHNDDPPMLEELKQRREIAVSELSKIKSLSFVPPEGAFYVFVNVSRVTKNSAKWCEDLLDKAGVCLVPGEAFGAPGFARLSFATDEENLKKAISKMREFINNEGKK